MSHRTDRRHRKHVRERREIPPPLTPDPLSRNGRKGDAENAELFHDPAKTMVDLQLVRRAINQEWDVRPFMRRWLFGKIVKLVDHTDGVSEYESDRNSILACATLFDMHQASLRDKGLIAQGRAEPFPTPPIDQSTIGAVQSTLIRDELNAANSGHRC